SHTAGVPMISGSSRREGRGLPGGNRRHADDASPAPLDHGLGREPRHQECADGVDRDDALPAFRIGLEEFDPGVLVPGRGGHADAGAIDQDIERAEGLERLVNGMPAICGLGHIGDAVEEFSGKHWFGGEAIETRRVDVDARDLGAGARERAGHHPPHAVRRPGNNGYAAREYLRLCHDALPPAQTMTNRLGPFNRAQLPHARCTGDRADVSSHAENTRRERTMWRARLATASLALIATSAALGSARAEDAGAASAKPSSPRSATRPA